MKNSIWIALLAIAIFVSTVPAHAEPFETIRLNIQNIESVRVKGELVKIDAVTEAVLKNVRGNDSISITIIVPLGMNRAALKKVMAACRKAGAKHFVLISKA